MISEQSMERSSAFRAIEIGVLVKVSPIFPRPHPTKREEPTTGESQQHLTLLTCSPSEKP
jgi:hypothetical protein